MQLLLSELAKYATHNFSYSNQKILVTTFPTVKVLEYSCVKYLGKKNSKFGSASIYDNSDFQMLGKKKKYCLEFHVANPQTSLNFHNHCVK